MKSIDSNQLQNSAGAGFDLFRLSRAKQVVDICANTIRAYHAEGLPLYKRGKAVFVSRSELDSFLRAKGNRVEPKPANVRPVENTEKTI